MTLWFRAYDSDTDTWSYFELDDEEWALRQVDLRGPRRQPVTAASLAEIFAIHGRGDFAAMTTYDQRYGVLTEGCLRGWQEEESAAEITLAEFESVWAAAREVLDADRTEETAAGG